MKLASLICFLLALTLDSSMASYSPDAPEGITCSQQFTSIFRQARIESAYKADRSNLVSEIKELTKETILVKWSTLSGLARKIDKELPKIEDVQNNFWVQVREKGKPTTNIHRTVTYAATDTILDETLSLLTEPQLRSALAMLHKCVFYDDILALALSQAPDDLWIGAEYVPYEPKETIIFHYSDLATCYKNLWETRFPTSNKQLSSPLPANLEHNFLGYSSGLPASKHSGFLAYMYKFWNSCQGCSKKVGRTLSNDPLFYLAEPRIRLFKYASSYAFPVVLDYTKEKRVHYFSWYTLSPYSHVFLPPRTKELPRGEAPAIEPVSSKKSKKAIPATIQLQKREERAETLSKEKEALEVELEKRLNELKDLRTKLTATAAEKSSFSEKNKDLQVQSQQLQSKLTMSESKLSEGAYGKLELENSKLKTMLDSANQNVHKLTAQIQMLNRELEGKQILISAHPIILKDLKHSNLVLQQERDELKLAIDGLNEKLCLLEAELKSKQITTDALAEQIRGLNKGMRAKEQELQRALKAQKANHKKTSTKDTSEKKLQEEVLAREKLEKDLASHRQLLAEQLQKINHLQAQLTDAQAYITADEAPQDELELMEEEMTQLAYEIDADLHLLEAYAQIHQLTLACEYYYQTWAATAQQLGQTVTEVTAATRNINMEVDGEYFSLTEHQLFEYASNYLREHVLESRPHIQDQDKSKTE